MTWNSPKGKRVLEGSERLFFKSALRSMMQELVDGNIDELETGVAVFDSMNACQQIAMLNYVRKYLMEETDGTQGSSAVIDGTAAAILAYVSCQLDLELEMAEFLQHSKKKESKIWRKLLWSVIKERKWKIRTKDGIDWELAISHLFDRILPDRDFEFAHLDLPPEKAQALKGLMGISNDYFSAIPLPEPDGPELLEAIRDLMLWDD